MSTGESLFSVTHLHSSFVAARLSAGIFLISNNVADDIACSQQVFIFLSIGGNPPVAKRKEYQRLLNKFEMEGFMAQKGLWNLARNKPLQDRGALPGEEGDAIREYKAMHEENFLSSWLREDGKGKTKREMEVDKEVEDVVKKRKKSQGERRR